MKATPHPGPKPKLRMSQRRTLQRLLRKGALAHGCPTDLWTLKRIAELIEKHFGVEYDRSGVWHVLKSFGWSCAKPERRTRRRDKGAVVGWHQRAVAPGRKRPAKRS